MRNKRQNDVSFNKGVPGISDPGLIGPGRPRNDYILVYKCTSISEEKSIKIHAIDYIGALVKAYSFLGENKKLNAHDFEILCRSDNLITRKTKRLEDFTGITVLFFGELSTEFVNAGIKCIDGEQEKP